jgi:hypothetical protein
MGFHRVVVGTTCVLAAVLLSASPSEGFAVHGSSGFVAPARPLRISKSGSALRNGRVPIAKVSMTATRGEAVDSASLSREEVMQRSQGLKYEWEWETRQSWSTDWTKLKEEFTKNFGTSADKWDMIRYACSRVQIIHAAARNLASDLGDVSFFCD